MSIEPTCGPRSHRVQGYCANCLPEVETWEQRMSARSSARAEKATLDDARWQTREAAEASRVVYCAECSEVFRDGVWGWRTRICCGNLTGGCEHGHSHHDDEVWIA